MAEKPMTPITEQGKGYGPDTGGSSQRYCRRCLIRDTDQAVFFQNMYEYIRLLPEEDKVSSEEYERRLAICQTCNKLWNGMCGMCGCFVEMRAAMRIRSCPGIPDRWQN